MMKSNTKTKSGYKKSKLGWIPEEWELKKLGKLFEFRNGVNASKEDYGQGIKFVNVMDVLENTFITEEKILGSVQLTEKQIERNLVKKGDVLFNRTSETQEEIGLTALYNDDVKAVFGGFVIRGRPKNNSLNHQYNGYSFQSELVRKQIISKGQGAVRVNIGQSDLEQVLFPLPPLPEQKKIAEILSTWDRAIETLEQLIAKKEELIKGLMQQLLTGKKRFPGFEGEWKEVRFKDVVKIDAKSLNSKTSPDYEFEYISLSDVENGQINDDLEVYKFKDAPSRAKRIVSDGDILMATVRPNLQAFAMAKEEHKGMIASTGFAVLTPQKDFNIKYLYHYLFSHHISGQFYALTVGSNYPAINSSDVKKLKIRLPEDHEEINKIESVLTNIDKEIKSLENNKELLVIQKQGLMQQLLTGKTRVKT